MSSTSALIPVQAHGWRTGFANFFSKENREWWRTRSWLVHLIIVMLVVVGTVVGLLFAPLPESGGDPTLTSEAEVLVSFPLQAIAATSLFVIIGGIYVGIVSVIVMQDALIGEKQTGTAAWVLSKPVSRTAFMAAKLLANSIAMTVILVLIPGLVVYAALNATGASVLLGSWLVGLALLSLNLLFYISLTFMLGTLFDTRGPVIGIPMLVLFGGQFLLSLLPALANIMPWAITMPLQANSQPLGFLALTGLPIANPLPIISTAVLTVVFAAVAFWRFQRQEL